MDVSRYMDLFLAESREHLAAAHRLRAQLEAQEATGEPWLRLMRHAHSIKGMAASMRLPAIVTLTHAIEDLAEQLAVGARNARSTLPLIDDSLICLGTILDAIERGEPAEHPRVAYLVAALRLAAGGAAAAAPSGKGCGDPPGGTTPAAKPRARRWTLRLRFDRDGGQSAGDTVAILGAVGRLARIVVPDTPRLDPATGRFRDELRLVVASDLPGHRLREELAALVGSDGFTLAPETATSVPPEVGDEPPSWIRVRADKLDRLVEGLLELKRRHGQLRAALPSAGRALHDQLGLAELRRRELYAAAMDMRLVPFDSVAQRLREAVYELAAELGKQVAFEIEGGEVQLDRGMLEALIDPLLHGLKNAVDHGIEPPAERRRRGKTPRASLRLALRRAAERVRICIEDDGRGMRPELLRKVALEQGLMPAEQIEALGDEQLLLLTTLPGVTTRPTADHVSGRGIGLDVVRQTVEQLGGSLEIRSERERGCALLLCVPLSRAQIRTLLVRSAGQPFAVPIEAVERTIEARSAPAGLQLMELRQRLGLEASPDRSGRAPALVLADADPATALLVDEVLGRRDLLVQPLPPPLAGIGAYSGAALLDDESIALVIEPPALLGELRFSRDAARAACGSAASGPRR